MRSLEDDGPGDVHVCSVDKVLYHNEVARANYGKPSRAL